MLNLLHVGLITGVQLAPPTSKWPDTLRTGSGLVRSVSLSITGVLYRGSTQSAVTCMGVSEHVGACAAAAPVGPLGASDAASASAPQAAVTRTRWRIARLRVGLVRRARPPATASV